MSRRKQSESTMNGPFPVHCTRPPDIPTHTRSRAPLSPRAHVRLHMCFLRPLVSLTFSLFLYVNSYNLSAPPPFCFLLEQFSRLTFGTVKKQLRGKHFPEFSSSGIIQFSFMSESNWAAFFLATLWKSVGFFLHSVSVRHQINKINNIRLSDFHIS